MYILDAGRLRHDLLLGRVTPAEFAIYAFLVAGVSFPVWVSGADDLTSRSTSIDLVLSLARLFVVGLGTRACYLANGGSEGRDFLNRFIPLGFVIGIRLALVAVVPAFVLASFLVDVVPGAFVGHMMSIIFVSFEALYFWRLSLQLSRLRAAEPPIRQAVVDRSLE